jgi:hypothetical protein
MVEFAKRRQGKQYIVVAIGGIEHAGEYVALSLP